MVTKSNHVHTRATQTNKYDIVIIFSLAGSKPLLGMKSLNPPTICFHHHHYGKVQNQESIIALNGTCIPLLWSMEAVSLVTVATFGRVNSSLVIWWQLVDT